LPVTSGSEVDSDDVLGLLGDDGVDDGVWEGLASSPAWAASSIASCRGGKEQLELGSMELWSWARTNASNTKEGRGWRSYIGTRDVKASLLAKPTGSRWFGVGRLLVGASGVGQRVRLENNLGLGFRRK
jgi:hypothetical protein